MFIVNLGNSKMTNLIKNKATRNQVIKEGKGCKLGQEQIGITPTKF